MSQKPLVLEVRGANVEQAVQSGLVQLGLDRHEVSIEIIDEGSRGLLGIGSRDAVVKLSSLVKQDVATPPASVVQPVVKEPVTTSPTVPAQSKPEVELSPEKDRENDDDTAVSPTPEIDLEAEQAVALEVLQSLLEKMKVDADLSTSLSDEDDVTRRQINIIEINGNDLGILIGPRGETLSSIQYLARLMVGHKMQRRVDFIVDVEKYRQRREQALTRLAERMAQKAVTRGRPVGLEPMPPNERRVIHMALRNHDAVYTESSGEGKRRKVRILPK